MARHTPTAIERLGPEAEQFVSLRLNEEMRGMVTMETICSEIRAKFAAEVPLSTLSSYKQRRYLRRLARLQKVKDLMEAAEQRLGDYNLSKTTQAELLELFDQALVEGAKLDPHFLLSERRKWADLEFKGKQFEQHERELDLRVKQFETQQTQAKEAIEETADKIGKGNAVTAADIERLRERLFGRPEAAASPAAL